ncbi:hypothetical protein V5O48_015191 [Marasmius crinis-equi]|uniref:Uncharacterized protein n=1 Tax=Marasmius crinis-equi TaxID=585013 RepID=A0ABR3EV75_9AGAR
MNEETLANFQNEMQKAPTAEQLEEWRSIFGLLACPQCFQNRVPCLPLSGALASSTAACNNCFSKRIICGRMGQERQYHVQKLFKMDENTFRLFCTAVVNKTRSQQPPPSHPVAVSQIIDPRALSTTSSTSPPNEPPLFHIPTPIPQLQQPSLAHNFVQLNEPSQFPHVQSSDSIQYPQPSQPSSSLPNIPQNSSISQIVPNLDSKGHVNQKPNAQVTALPPTYQALQAANAKLMQEWIKMRDDRNQLAKLADFRIKQMQDSERAKQEEVLRLNTQVQSLNTQVERLTAQVESDLKRKLYLESELERMRGGGEGTRAVDYETWTLADDLRKTKEDMRKKEETHHQERRQWEERVKKKDDEISDELSRSNKLVASRSKDYLLLTSLMKSYTDLRDQIQAQPITPQPTTTERFDELSTQMRGLAEKMRGDMLGALCVDNAVQPGEQRSEDKDVPARRRLKRLRVAGPDAESDRDSDIVFLGGPS